MPNSRILKAAWILPVDSAPISKGAIVIKDGNIAAVLSEQEAADKSNLEHVYELERVDGVEDCGDSIIVPGLINAHSHLDYSALTAFKGESRLFEWICALVSRSVFWTPEQFLDSALIGARQSALSGVTCIVDSSYSGQSLEAIAQTGMRGLVGLELFGLKEADAQLTWSIWLERMKKLESDQRSASREALQSGRIRLTVAPHAPYTVCPSLWKLALRWADDNKHPLLGHLAESEEESLWFKAGNRTVDDYLTYIRKLFNPDLATNNDGIAFDVADVDWNRSGRSPVQHLNHHSLLNSNLIAAHVINADQEDLGLLARAGVSIAHCPRSNARLGNGRAPIDQFIANQINFAIGTDSLASSDDLNLLNECRATAAIHKAALPNFSLPAEHLLRRVTIEPARMLGLSDLIGTITPGKRADLSIFKIESTLHDDSNPFELLMHGQSSLRESMVDGIPVVRNGKVLRMDAAKC